MTTPKRLSRDLSVTVQIDPDSLDALAAAGFRSIISNRPDGEEPGQPDWARMATAAQDAGLQARHIPVVPGAIGAKDVALFRAAINELPGPVLAFCRTGTRAAQLWALANVGSLGADEIIDTAGHAGYDLSQMRDRLTQS